MEWLERYLENKMDETNWPPRFTFTARGIAGLYLRKYFGDRADSADVGELTALIEDCVDKAVAADRERCAAEFVENGRAIGRLEEREACAVFCDQREREPLDDEAPLVWLRAAEGIRMRSNV